MMNSALMDRRMTVVPSRVGAQLLPGLISYWPLNELAGVGADLWGGNHLTDNNTVTSEAGPSTLLPAARSFASASSESLSRTDNASLSVEAQSWSFLIWAFLTDTAADHGIAAKDDNSAGNREWNFRYQVSVADFTLLMQNSTTNILTLPTAGVVPVINTWYMLLLTYNTVSRGASVSVNAGTRFTGTASADVTASGASFRIGRDWGTNYMQGRLAGAAFWKGRIITTAEEAWLYNGGMGRRWPW